MSYVARVLQPDEKIRHTATIHWIIYVPGLFFVLLGVAVAAVGRLYVAEAQWVEIAGGVIVIFGVLRLLGSWFRRWTTELAVTDRRIIWKRGFIRRHTIEMNMDKVESVDVDQGILGRMLDFGDITIRGTGEGIEPLRTIGAPIAFRNHVTAS